MNAKRFWVFTLVLGGAGCTANQTNEANETLDVQVAAIDANASIVISQVYGGGNNSGAPYQNDFVELFNRSAAPLTLDTLSVQYASATGTGTFAGNGVLRPTGTLQPGGYYLIKLGGGTTNGAPLPTADLTGSINMSGTAGKVVLVNGITGLSCNSTANCSQAQRDSIIDAVGYGTATDPIFEGTAAAPSLSNMTAAIRAGNGCTDTNQNSTDFTAGAPNPRNTATVAAPCGGGGGNQAPFVSTTTPTNGAMGVAVGASLGVTFSENVTLTGTWFTLSCATSGNVAASVSGGPQSYVLDPTIDLGPAESCTLTVLAANVADSEGAHPTANFAVSFTTAAPTSVVAIHTIQGATHVSPLNTQSVTTRGIVTALDANGYYLQDPVPDANDATSEAIFVFTSSAPSVHVGDDLQVTGVVSEFRAGCTPCSAGDDDFNNLTLTELVTPSGLNVFSPNNPLPAQLLIGPGGRVPPTQLIEDDASGDVEAFANTFDPASDGLDFYESLENMRVELDNAVAVGPTKVFSSGSTELPLLAAGGTGASLRTARGGIVVRASDYNPERVILANDVFVGTRPVVPMANVGDTFSGAIVGVMSYSFGNFKLFETQALPPLAATGVSKETSSFAAPRSVDLDIAAFNVENLDPSDPASKFSELAGILVNRLKSPDLVSLEEIQDNNGATDNGVVDATTTLSQLTAAITAAGGPTYSFSSINPVNDADGGEPGGNIRVVFLYRTDRGLALVSRPGATSTTANSVVSAGGVPALAFSPGRIEPTNSAFNSSRKPLAAEFTFQGRTLFVIGNHWNSKGGDQPLYGRFQPPTLSSEAQRTNQATIVKNFVSQIYAVNASADVVVLGDLNDFEFAIPLTTVKSAGLSDLIEGLPANERYTYVYDGNSQTLDHVLVSAETSRHLLGFDVVHVNSEFATQASDHDPGVARISFDRTAPVISGPTGTVMVSATGPSGASVTYSVTALDAVDGALSVTCTPPSGSVFGVGTSAVACSASDSSGNTANFGFSVKVNAAAPTVPAAPPWALLLLSGALLMLGVHVVRTRANAA